MFSNHPLTQNTLISQNISKETEVTRMCIQIPKLKMFSWGVHFNIFLPSLGFVLISPNLHRPQHLTHQTQAKFLQRKWGLDSQRALAL